MNFQTKAASYSEETLQQIFFNSLQVLFLGKTEKVCMDTVDPH